MMYCIKTINQSGIKYDTYETKAEAEKHLADKGFRRCSKSKDVWTNATGSTEATVMNVWKAD